ncbi:MAG: TonB-dependent receptor [Asticcacaulis sp.]|uniref:TonB-dependent receptor n=1 Tax=Asticcacaulis sp. TaxID=1872648 RepID=UPI0039E557CA
MKGTYSKALASTSALILSLAGLAGAAYAAEPDAISTDAAVAPTDSSSEPTEIVVTAEFRKTNIQKTPVAVTAISADTLQTKGLQTLRDITVRVPGLIIAPSALTNSTGSYYIRGIGETDSIANQTVGTYIDDVYISRPIGGTFDFNDVQDIEVLRGPQGTLYGRNSSAGAIKITTKLPGNDFHAFVEVAAGNRESSDFRAGISGPLIKNILSGSLAVVKRYRQGLVLDKTLNTYVGTLDTTGLRGKLNFTPTEHSSYLLTVESFEDKGDPTPLVPRSQPDGVLDPNVNYSETRISNHTKLWGASLKATYGLSDKSTLKLITSVRQFTQPGLYDQDGSATVINRTYSDHRDLNWSQEVQYLYDGQRWHVVAGVFGLYDNFESYRTNYSPSNSTALLPNRTYLQDSGEKTRNLSAYTQVTYDVTSKLHLIFGERYTWEAHNFVFTGNEQNTSGQYLTTLYTVREPWKNWTSLTPKLGVNYELTPAISTYVTYSQGFKAGGYDGRASSKAAAQIPYDPETVTTWEGGIKSDLFNRALRANLSVYTNDIDGYQASVQDADGITHRINLGQVRTQGFELETRWRPFDGLNWTNNLTLVDSKVLSAGGAASNATTYDGKQVPYTPKWQYFSGLDYDLPVHFHGTYSLGAEYYYRSILYTDLANTAAAAGEAQRIVNVSASWRPDDAHWVLSATIRNIGNKRYQQGGTAGNGVTTINATTFNDPELFQVRLRYQY